MKFRIGIRAVAAVIILGVVIISHPTVTLFEGAAWSKAPTASLIGTDVHIKETRSDYDGNIIAKKETWFTSDPLLREESGDKCTIDDGRCVLVLNKKERTAELRDSKLPYDRYPPCYLLDAFFGHDVTVPEHRWRSILPEESSAELLVFKFTINDYQGKAWVDPASRLPRRITGVVLKEGASMILSSPAKPEWAIWQAPEKTEKFEMVFAYEPILDETFSTALPKGYKLTGRHPFAQVLSGRIVDEQGKPVADAGICCSLRMIFESQGAGRFTGKKVPWDGWAALRPNNFPVFLRAFRSDDPSRVAWTVIRHPSVGYHENDRGGTIRSDPGKVIADADYDDDDDDALPENAKVQDIVLVMGPAGVITGRVTDSSGKPIADAVVQVEEMELVVGNDTISVEALGSANKRRLRTFAVTDSDGRYSLNNLPASWEKVQLEVTARGYDGGEFGFKGPGRMGDGPQVIGDCNIQLFGE